MPSASRPPPRRCPGGTAFDTVGIVIPREENRMEYRRLGRSDLQVSEISLGSWLTIAGGIERSQAEACVRRALDLGVNFIDTANEYGRGAAESLLGDVLEPVDRSSYVLAT